MKRTINIIIVIFFAVAISLPVVLSDKVGGKVSKDENRVLATFPNISLIVSDSVGLRSNFEKWANDNMGFRKQAIQLDTLIKYNLLKGNPAPDTLRGKNNWLYYYTDYIIKDFQHLNTPEKTHFDEQLNSFKILNSYLYKRGIPFITVLLPDKKTVYPEFYPKGILQTENESRSSLIESRFETASIDFIYPLQNLLESKKDATIYSPRVDNAHWNMYGAFVGYKAIMERVSSYFQSTRILDFEDFTIDKYEQSRKINSISEIKENAYNFTPKYASSVHLSNQGYWEDKPKLKHEHLRYVNDNKSLPKLIIVGDSYFFYTPILPIFAESFSEVLFIHNNDSNLISSYVDIVNPDLIVYEMVERMFDGASASLQEWSKNVKYEEELFSLPEKDCVPEMYNGMIIDYVNGRGVKIQGEIDIMQSDNGLSLIGWTADFNSKLPAAKLYAKVGDKLYEAKYGISRSTVAEYYKNPDLENTGFEITLPKEVLNAKEINFIIVSNDSQYRYKEIPYKLQHAK